MKPDPPRPQSPCLSLVCIAVLRAVVLLCASKLLCYASGVVSLLSLLMIRRVRQCFSKIIPSADSCPGLCASTRLLVASSCHLSCGSALSFDTWTTPLMTQPFSLRPCRTNGVSITFLESSEVGSWRSFSSRQKVSRLSSVIDALSGGVAPPWHFAVSGWGVTHGG